MRSTFPIVLTLLAAVAQSSLLPPVSGVQKLRPRPARPRHVKNGQSQQRRRLSTSASAKPGLLQRVFGACSSVISSRVILPAGAALVGAWRLLPAKLPSWWLANGLSKDRCAQALFLASNAAYLLAGSFLTLGAQAELGVLTLCVCGASLLYHAAQCTDGCSSASAARWCQVDTALAVSSGIVFATRCGVGPENLALAALSGLFFVDAFSLGYTTTHSLWHVSTAATAVMSVARLPEATDVLQMRKAAAAAAAGSIKRRVKAKLARA